MSKRLSPIWRRILSWVFLILFCLAVPVALVTGWARLTVVNENVYVKTVGAAAGDPEVQLGISHAVTTRVEERLAGDNPSATEALQSRVVAEALGEVTRGVVASEEFHQTWEEANRKAHRFLASELAEGPGQPVTLDLSPLLADIQAQVAAADVDVPPDLALDAEALQIEVLDAATADRVRRGLMRLDLAFTTALVVALLLPHFVGGAGTRPAGGDRARGVGSGDRDDRSHGADVGGAGMAHRQCRRGRRRGNRRDPRRHLPGAARFDHRTGAARSARGGALHRLARATGNATRRTLVEA